MRAACTVAISAGALLAACTVGPNYKQPKVQTPARFEEAAPTPAAPTVDLSQWWMRLDDPELHKLIVQALAANLDLQTAASRVRQARLAEIVAGAPGLPQVGSSAVAAKLHSNSNPLASLGGSSSSSSASGSSHPSGLDTQVYSLGFDATWEIDLFGGVRRAVEAARANTEAALWQMRDGQVSLTAEIANDYMALRAAQARLAILNAEYRSEADILNLITGRVRAGFLTQLDTNQQKAQVASTAAQIPAAQSDIRTQEQAIAVLLAEQPEALVGELDATAPLPALPASLPVGLPSDLLRQRPDVRAAERALAAATANEGVAVAALYPKFDLIGLLSLANSNLGSLFTSHSLSEVGVGTISWPIFGGGRLHANIRSKQEDEQQAYLAYQNTVLKAVHDVEQALLQFRTAGMRAADLKTAVDSGQSSVDLATHQYNVGLVPYVNVLTAQNQYNAAQDQYVQNEQARAQAFIAVFKALGGGWSENAPQIAAKPATEWTKAKSK